MFRRKTLFVVGAGASAEFGLPLGSLLARQITNKMDIRFERGVEFVGSGDQRLYEQLIQSRRGNPDQWQPAAMRIRGGLPFAQSIDDFLDQRRNDSWINLYGKSAICKSILEAERESKLYFRPLEGDGPFDAGTIAETWLVKFMYMLCRGIPREDVEGIFENVDFVVFNYDRCIEQFLTSALERAYSLNQADASAIVEHLDILHPYGSVGRLNQVPFGNSGINCVALAEQIKTYTEQADKRTVLNEITERVDWAECIVFLGFAYHSQNMQMLQTTDRGSKTVYGTAFGMSDQDKGEVYKLVVQTLAPTTASVENTLKCAGLFDSYAKSLTGGD
jgi:hypothetical protein